jgi:serine/threonine protein kinase/Tfp pilus assembly protein PilF
LSESQRIELTTQSVCARCGACLASTVGWEGVCVHCLLLSALDQENVDPSTTSQNSDDELPIEFGDYELLEEIGRGGQGVVYRAHQTSLNRTVALKVISLGQWASKAHLKRFRREAEAVARLEHPGIVPIHEVGERDGSCYFSMQFIEGGQLEEVVRDAPISIQQSAELVTNVARIVHYAHEHGILHRDIKPGNILLDKKGEPHLTDFGLARLVETESTVTGTLEVLGTPSYMAPEQAAGEHAKVSKATDVYGLGAVLYQLLTGQQPFAGGTSYETIKLLLETEPRPPRLINPKIDRDLSTICLKCLEKDPQRRYSSALALAEDLERWLKREPIQARRTGVFTRGRKWVQRNPSSVLFAASVTALVAAVGWIIWKSEFLPDKVAAINGVAVLPFEDLSGDPDKAYFADGIQEEILTRLAKIAGLKVISRTSTQHYQSQSRNVAEIAKQLGVANILEGSVQKAADQVRINVQLVKATNDSRLWADTYDRKLTDIFGVESEIAKRIAHSLQVKLTGREEQALAVKPTNNAEAYDAYLQGLALDVRSLTVSSRSNSIDSYERAVQLDPNFALAWARLSRAEANHYFAFNESTGRGAAKRALEQAQKLDPDSPETLLALGYYQQLVLLDNGAAKTTFKRVGKLLPSSSEASYALGRLARREGHWDEAVSYFVQALELDPRNVELLRNATYTYIALRQFTTALKLLDRVLDITPNDPGLIGQEARVYQAEGNLPEAARLLSEIKWQIPEDEWSDQLRYERKYGEAIRFLQAQLGQFNLNPEKEGSCLTNLAFTQLVAGDAAGAKVSAQQALNIFEPLYREKPDDVSFIQPLSQIYALMGEKDLALKLAKRAVMLKPRATDAASGPTFEESLAVVQALVGENSRAISTLTQLLQTPYFGSFYGPPVPITPALLRLDPIWDPLRSDPAFQKLCEEKQTAAK